MIQDLHRTLLTCFSHAMQVHIRKGRPIERFLFQTAEVALTAAAVCLITLASNRIRKKSDRDKQPEAKKGSQVCLEASAIHHKSAVKWEQ